MLWQSCRVYVSDFAHVFSDRQRPSYAWLRGSNTVQSTFLNAIQPCDSIPPSDLLESQEMGRLRGPAYVLALLLKRLPLLLNL